ncbi:gamma-glutamyl-gamma-aminobutyrate hydrolase family protein, partial [Actinomadura logoneensis]
MGDGAPEVGGAERGGGSAGGRAEPPLIGITTYLESARWAVWEREAAVLGTSYPRAVERVGGVAVLLPPTGDPRGVRAMVRGLDGIVFAGGADVEPGLYGAARHPATGPAQPRRDGFELALMRAVMAAGLPFLAICRGMQLLNVACGGGLVQHLPETVGHRDHAPASGVIGRHRVRFDPASATGRLLGGDADVPTYHHQAVDRLGEELAAVAWADDGVVEAVELRGHRFGLGVQWHPEEDDDPRLFEALVAAATGPRAAATGPRAAASGGGAEVSGRRAEVAGGRA